MQIREVDVTGISKNICIDSIINVPRKVFDSIIMNQLTVPQEIERLSKCYGCFGTTFVSFITFNKKLIETKTLRGFDIIGDSILLLQHKSIYDIIEKNSNFEKDKFYFITIGVRFELVAGEDNKVIERIDSLGGSYYILKKSKIDIRFKTDSIPFNFFPKNIEECITQLDTILTEETKNKIRTWDKDYFDYKANYRLYHWIFHNWKIPCGITTSGRIKSELEQYFSDLGITESCYIATVVMNCYYNHLTSGNLKFIEEINNCLGKLNK